SLIPHAGAIRTLVIGMIRAAFRAAPMPAARGADRGVAGGRTTRRRAIRVAPITRRADREEPVAAPAGFLAKRRVHVGAAAHSNWTRTRNRGTTDSDRSRSVGASRRSPTVWRGKAPGPHLVPSAYAAPRSSPQFAPNRTKRLWTLTQPWTHRTRPPLLGNLAEEREIPTSAHSHSLLFRRTKTKNNYNDAGPDLRGFR